MANAIVLERFTMKANECILLLAENDPQYTPVERQQLKWWLGLSGDERTAIFNGFSANVSGCPDSVMSRKEVAHAFGKSIKWVDWIAKKPGCPFRRIRLGSSRRSCGFSANSVRAALSGNSIVTTSQN